MCNAFSIINLHNLSPFQKLLKGKLELEWLMSAEMDTDLIVCTRDVQLRMLELESALFKHLILYRCGGCG